MRDRAEREGLEHEQHGVGHVAAQDHRHDRLGQWLVLIFGVTVLGGLFAGSLGCGLRARRREVLVHGVEHGAEQLHAPDTVQTNPAVGHTRLVVQRVELVEAGVGLAEGKTHRENQVLELFLEDITEVLDLDVVEVLGARAVLGHYVAEQVLGIGRVLLVNLALAADIDHEF